MHKGNKFSVEAVHGSEVTTNSDGNILATSCNFSNFHTLDVCTCLGEEVDVALMKTDDCLIELEKDDVKSTYT